MLTHYGLSLCNLWRQRMSHTSLQQSFIIWQFEVKVVRFAAKSTIIYRHFSPSSEVHFFCLLTLPSDKSEMRIKTVCQLQEGELFNYLPILTNGVSCVVNKSYVRSAEENYNFSVTRSYFNSSLFLLYFFFHGLKPVLS